MLELIKPMNPLLSGLALILSFSPASADFVTLRHGARLTGIVTERTPDTLALRVSAEGWAYLDPATVASVEAQDADAHRRLISRWKREALELAKAESAEARARSKEMDRRLELRRLELETVRLAPPAPQIFVTIEAPPPAVQTIAIFPALRAPPSDSREKRPGRTSSSLAVPHPWSFDWGPTFAYAFMTPRF